MMRARTGPPRLPIALPALPQSLGTQGRLQGLGVHVIWYSLKELCWAAGYFDAPGAAVCPLVGGVPPDVVLPKVTMVFTAMSDFAAMKVTSHPRNSVS